MSGSTKRRGFWTFTVVMTAPVLLGAAPPIPPSCPAFPPLNLPGVLCETFDTERNGVPGFQWSRLPVASDPGDPLRGIGDPADDVLGYTMSGGPSPLGTAGVICTDDNLGYVGCQAPVAEENDWHLHSPFEGPGDGYTPPGQPVIGAPDGGKAHSGFRSMHMGRHLNPTSTLGDTLRLRQVSAFVLDTQGDPGIPGLVPGPASTMEFWHMLSVPDNEGQECGGFSPCASFGGGQVQISLLGPAGTFERWQRLTPSFNGYDTLIQESTSICGFDPGDDFIAPANETMCDSSPLFSEKGDIFGTDPTCITDTDGDDPAHKDCGDITCAPGPGCTSNGSIGTGVWTRSAFDLSPFAGRVARLRWIGMVEGGWAFETWRSALEPDIGSAAYQYFEDDDGWFVDDIRLTDLRSAADQCPADRDGDGLDECGDCNDSDITSWQSPSEVDSLRATHDRATGITTWTWDPPAQSGGSVVHYDVLRSLPGDSYHGFGASSSCAETNDSGDTAWVEPPALLPPGQFAAYLVRARNGCYGTNVHNIGHASNGTTREGRACP
jgi:hypothetical protein